MFYLNFVVNSLSSRTCRGRSPRRPVVENSINYPSSSVGAIRPFLGVRLREKFGSLVQRELSSVCETEGLFA